MLDGGLLGPLWIAWTSHGLAALRFGTEGSDRERARIFGEGGGTERPLPGLIEDRLGRYLAGEAIDPAQLPVELIGATEFQAKAWAALRRVARGQVRTYAGLGSDAGSPRGMRAIGMAMAHNPIAIVIPCHRIVAAGARIGGYSGGLERKRILLALEGVRIEGDRVLPGQMSLL